MLRRLTFESAGAAVAVIAATGLLLSRLAPDVRGKPLFIDEVVAGLIAALPITELLAVVVSDRGGAPAHFVLVHAAFAVSSSADMLRWVSVACALAAVPLTYDLARRLHGSLAGVIAATVVATSQLLAVYGSVGRMYAFLVMTAALAADLFIRALEAKTAGAVLAAGASAALLPFVHPCGGFLLAAEAAVALVLWRARPIRLALLAAGAVVVLTPLSVTAARLAERFGIGLNGDAGLLTPFRATRYLAHGLAEFAGGGGIVFVLAFASALAGGAVVWRRNPGFVMATAVAMALPILVLIGLPAGRPGGLAAAASTRHLIFALPLWAALCGAGCAALLERLPRVFAPLGVVAIAFALAQAPSSGSADPRTRLPVVRANADRAALAAPAQWLRRSTQPGDVLFYPAHVYLEGLPATGKGRLLDPARGVLEPTLGRLDYPVPGAIVAVPLGEAEVKLAGLRRTLRSAALHRSDRWLVLRLSGPLAHPRALLGTLHRAFVELEAAVEGADPRLRLQLRSSRIVLCGALRRRGGCPDDDAEDASKHHARANASVETASSQRSPDRW